MAETHNPIPPRAGSPVSDEAQAIADQEARADRLALMMAPDMIFDLRRNLHRIPEHCRDGLYLYLTEGRPVGGFLTALLKNDLRDAVNRADEKNVHALGAYVVLLTSYAPASAWGSPAAVDAWLTKGRERLQR